MASKVTLRQWFNRFSERTKETPTHVQLWTESKWDWDWAAKDEPWMVEEREAFPRPSWVVADIGTIWNYNETPKEILDFEFDDGYGSADAPPVIAWSKSYVLYIHEYDGAQSLKWIPKYPEKFAFQDGEQ